jgi:hypothetical protein
MQKKKKNDADRNARGAVMYANVVLVNAKQSSAM